jgi:hypothetical protein
MRNIDFLLNRVVSKLSFLGCRCKYISDSSIDVNGNIYTNIELVMKYYDGRIWDESTNDT